MRDPLVLAYLAGVIDSDGYVTIQRTRHAGRTYYGARIGVSGTRRQPHDLAASLWGGTVSRYTPKNLRHRAQFQWSRSGVAAATAINEVLPFLRVKAEQARIALELNEHLELGRAVDPYPWFGPDYDAAVHAEELVAEIRPLNQDRRAGFEFDGRTWDEYPAVV
jgi:hypothetical protein